MYAKNRAYVVHTLVFIKIIMNECSEVIREGNRFGVKTDTNG
jgi:hypothetical protein